MISHQIFPKGDCSLVQSEGKIAWGIRITDCVFTSATEALLWCHGGVAQWRSGTVRWVPWTPRTKFSQQKPPSLHQHWWDGVCQLISKSHNVLHWGRGIFEYLPELLCYEKQEKVQYCGLKCPVLCYIWYVNFPSAHHQTLSLPMSEK